MPFQAAVLQRELPLEADFRELCPSAFSSTATFISFAVVNSSSTKLDRTRNFLMARIR
jgi:hypothetical protein